MLKCENTKGECEEITEIYRKNKKKREVTVIKVQDQNTIIKASRICLATVLKYKDTTSVYKSISPYNINIPALNFHFVKRNVSVGTNCYTLTQRSFQI